MPVKKACQIAIVCGAIAAIAVFLPWYHSSMSGMDDLANQMGMKMDTSSSANGTEGDFLGVPILILCLIGIAAAGVVAAGAEAALSLQRTQALLGAAILFGIAAVLTLVDVLRDVGGGSISMGNVEVSAGKSFGLYLTFLATIAATALAGVGVATAIREKEGQVAE